VTRQLLLLRHAKSSWDDPGLSDHDRPLNPRGLRAVEALREHLADGDVVPELVLCSTARRTVETWEGLVPAWPSTIPVAYEPDLYGATATSLLRRLRQVPDATGCVLVLGHNPGLQDLASGLAGDGDEEPRQRLGLKFPTAALATLEVPTGWAELSWQSATLADYLVPRDLTDHHSS
jgi:phosphohistidine phosphatase